MSETVYDSAFFQQHVTGSLTSARAVLPVLFRYYKPESVVDVGCGLGTWLKAAMDLGVTDVVGLDGDYVDRNMLMIPEANFHPTDLRRRIAVDRRFDLAISMEVAEHLPYHRSETFVRDLVALSDVVLFSAALPYQGGVDHVNEQWLEFWAILFQRYGYVPCDVFRRQFWGDHTVEFWYSQNLVVFCTKKHAAKTFPREFLASGRPLSYPHPLTFVVNAARYRPLSARALDLECEGYQSVLHAYQNGDGTLPLLRVADATDEAGAPLFPRCRTLITDPQAEISARDGEVARLTGELEAARGEAARGAERSGARDAEVARLTGELEAARGEAAILEAELGRLTTELIDLAESGGRLGAELAARVDEGTWLETENTRLAERLAAREGELDAYAQEIARRGAENDQLTQRLAVCEAALATYAQEIARWKAENDQLTQRLAVREAALATHAQEIARWKAENDRLTQRLTAREAELDAYAQKDARWKAGNDQLTRRLAAREAELAAHNQESARLQLLSKEFEKRLADASLQVQTREDELSCTHAELQESRHAVRALRESWSWRLTSPLRAVLDLALNLQRLLRGVNRRIPLRSKILGYLQWLWYRSQVLASGLFDGNFYLAHNPDVERSRADPLRHFFVFGAAEGRNPHPLFDLHYYAVRNPDVAGSSINPLVHYLKWGGSEGRNPHPDFDTSYYLDTYPEVCQSGLNPLAHFMGPGVALGLDPNPRFDVTEYLERNPDVALRGINPLLHHLEERATQSLRETPSVESSPQAPPATAVESGGLPPGMRVDPRTTELRVTLRADYEMSGRSPLDSEYDSIPLVSVVIPCYNYGYYLEDAILSAMMACSYPMEILVVDDGSADADSISAVEELAGRYRFRLLRQSHTGQAGARYNGIRNCQGKFIQFLDADDILAPGKIDLQVDMMIRDASIGIAVCEYELCEADGTGRRMVYPSTLAGFAFTPEDFLLRWERGFSLPIHCALFRRELLDGEQFQCITKAGKEDWIFWVVLASTSPRFEYHPDVLATYRIHGHNTFTNREGMGLDFLRACMYVLQAGLNKDDNFLEESIDHFRKAYLGSIKHEAIVWSRTHRVE